ncbi:MAG: universal stress protein [Nitrospiraceae bacterium]|nr:MAG: universal stress protein [Nitrospiraceae bacterium]
MKILLATDGSEYSEAAARFLKRFTLTKEDEILILYAINVLPVFSELEAFYVDFGEIRKEVAPRILGAAADILKTANAKTGSVFVEDFPDRAIVNKADEEDVDLVVMGARGLRGFGSYITGSVTRLVAINSPRPVLVIKPPQREISGKLKILFATDGSGQSEEMGRTLSSIPFPEDTGVTILNVVFPVLSDIPERFVLEIDDRMKELAAGAREAESRESEKIIKKAQEYLGNKFSKIEKITKFGDPSGEILHTAEEVKADIIAVGSSGMRGIRGMLGSVSRYVLNHSKCSVLIGKV